MSGHWLRCFKQPMLYGCSVKLETFPFSTTFAFVINWSSKQTSNLCLRLFRRAVFVLISYLILVTDCRNKTEDTRKTDPRIYRRRNPGFLLSKDLNGYDWISPSKTASYAIYPVECMKTTLCSKPWSVLSSNGWELEFDDNHTRAKSCSWTGLNEGLWHIRGFCIQVVHD